LEKKFWQLLKQSHIVPVYNCETCHCWKLPFNSLNVYCQDIWENSPKESCWIYGKSFQI